MSHLDSSLPATAETNPSDPRVTATQEEVFTPEELQKFQGIIRLADLAVSCIKDPSIASADSQSALSVMKEVGIIKEDMTPKEGRRAIGFLWKTVDDLMAGNGTSSEGFNLLHRLLVLMARRTQD